MAQTEDTYTQSDTTTVLRSFTFPYINQSDIKVELDGVATTAYSHPNLTQIQLNSAPAVGTVIRIYRQTSDEETPATFYAGSAIRARDLNNNFTQNLYVTQETNNNVASAWKTGDPTIISTETWAGNDTKVATTGAIDGRIDAKIDTALTTDVSGGDGVTIVDNNPGTGQIRVDLDADIATLKDMQSGAATSLAALTSTELQILDGATVTTTELNTLDGITATVTELNYTDGVTSSIQTQLNSLSTNKQPLDTELTELATMSAGTASALADLTQTEVQKIDGLTASTAELNKLDGATASTTELNHVTGVTSAIQTQFTGKQPLATDLTNLSSCQTGASSAIAALTQAEVQTLDGVTASTAELNILDGVTASTTELNKTDGLLATPVELNTLDGITSNTSELNKLDGYTGSTNDLNIVSGKSFKNTAAGTLDTTSDTEIPSSKVIAAHVASSQTAIGGFVTIADEVSFPNTQPQAGVVVSINNAAGLVVSGSGASTSAKRVDNTTVTINGFPSSLNGETLAAGVGLVVTSTSTANTYNYHKLLLSETDIKNISDEINDFTARYRIASSAPTSNNDAGDMYFDTSANKMKVYNGTTSSWDDVASVGNFYINTISSSSGTGGGSATFNGNAYRFTLSNAPVMAQQLIVSVNGVIQKPNAGTSQPSEGFAISSNDIIFAAAPPSGSDYFIVTQGSSVSIGTPSDNTVTSAKIVDGSIVNGDISSTANITGSKIADGSIANAKITDDSIAEVKLDIHNAPATNKYLKYTSNGMEWSDGASEGTDVKSTGESGTTKFLRVDGDGTCSWQVPPDNNTVYTHPNHSGEVTSTADGAQVIASNVVDEDNLKVSNSPTNGQVLSAQSGNAGGLTWTTISAAPEITATASGAIASGKAVIVNSNGTVSQPAITAPAFGSATQINTSNTNGSHDIIWCQAHNCFIYAWRDEAGNGYGKIKAGTISGTTITWGSEVTYHSGDAYHNKIAYDSVNDVIFVAYRNGGLSYRCEVRQIQISGTTIGTVSSVGTPYSNNNTEQYNLACNASGSCVLTFKYASQGRAVKITANSTASSAPTITSSYQIESNNYNSSALVYDPDEDKFVTCWNDQDSQAGRSRVMTLESNNSISMSSTTDWINDYTDYISLSYNTEYNKHLVVFQRQQSNGHKDLYSAVGTYSGGTITWATKVEHTSTHLERHVNSAYNPITYKHSVYWQAGNDSNKLKHADITISGTTPSLGTVTTLSTIGSDGEYNETAVSNAGAEVNISDTNNDDYYVARSPQSTSASATSFIGFASAAYSDGNTATVKVVGNTVTGLSGLTAGAKAYVQGNGDVSSTVSNPIIEAGIALSSTKLLIKG